MFAYGIMNFGGSFFGSFPTAGALSRTVLQDATGGNTQLVGCISSGIVIIVILFLGLSLDHFPVYVRCCVRFTAYFGGDLDRVGGQSLP